jgi:tetratricopeptide (TPR) repeat protein
MRVGEIRLSQRRFSEAAEIYRQGISNEPGSADLRYGMGTALRGMGRNEKALNSFEEALKINPSHAGALVGKAAIYYDLGNVPEAFDLLERVMKLEPQNPLPYGVMGGFYRDLKKPYEENLMLGQYYFYSQDMGRAISRFRAALVVNETSQAQHAIGSVLLKQGQSAESIRHFERALKLGVKPEDPVLAQMASALARTGKVPEAKALIVKAIRANGKLAEYHAAYAWILMLSRDPIGAEKEARTALKLDPENAGAYRYLGDSFNSRGLARDAIDAYEKCLARNPGLSDVYVNLGWAYEQTGDLVSAQRNYETFLRSRPPSDEAKSVRAHLAALRKRAGK